MSALPIGARVQLSTGKPCPKRGKWVIAAWQAENGQGTVSEIGADYFAVKLETYANGSPVAYQRTQVIHASSTHIVAVIPVKDAGQ